MPKTSMTVGCAFILVEFVELFIERSVHQQVDR